ncbi:V-type proton ATPase subunit C like [Actinidia chinensis var. chinensis]|uniref:V-type proton ATPase subunit C n=1 Tax=Actinidia chinensis var. chinensis TaxID=1590841 RepID=A0A2R6PSE3_ACTCC|nr:V-type proton ATPase subunit C like [Actinidia chinensis var. chinensis]
MTTRYWAFFLSVQNSASSLWTRLQELISKYSFDTPLYRFIIPNLRVGTLDSLLALSDDLLKSNAFIEGVSHKKRRQIEELERVSGMISSSLTVDGIPVDSYLTRYLCGRRRSTQLGRLSRRLLMEFMFRLPRLKTISRQVRVAEYNNARSQLNVINRKQSGRSVQFSEATGHHRVRILTTLLAIVPKYSENDWISSYATLTTYVVPRSSKQLYEDNDCALYTVILFSSDADNFRTAAREKGFQVFSSGMHFFAVRVFAESILRYGLPPSFLSVVMAPSVKSEKKVRATLEGLCDIANSAYWKSEDDGGLGGPGGDADGHPYISFTINLL